jgi:sulfur carrier protein
MPLTITLNGQAKNLDHLPPPVTLIHLITDLALKGDRIAVELNGTIAERSVWPTTALKEGDRLEVVHFVGGGR